MKMQRLYLAFATTLAVAGLAASQSVALRAQSTSPTTQAATEASSDAHVVEITATDYAYQAPDEIPSGWTTFRMKNDSEETHFALLSRLPEGKTLDDYMEEVGVHLDDAARAVRAGEIDKAEAQERLERLIPEWFGSLERIGGPGFVGDGRTAETTLKLEPGNYFLECYMKTEEGEFHAIEGMVRPLTVTEEDSGALEPEADIEVTLSNDGIEVEGELAPGQHTIAVHYAKHPEAGSPHDVHLARLDEGVGVTELVPWMDWLAADGLFNPAPVEFLGGAHEMSAGSTAYITVGLEPGRYAWISQMTAAQGMVKPFAVE